MIHAASLSLLVIVAGMFLLAKTQKENLSNMFKYVSYFVILSGFVILFGGGIFAVAKKCMRHMKNSQSHCEGKNECSSHHSQKSCSKMESCEEGQGCGEEKGMCIEKRIVVNGNEMGEGCEEGCQKPCCKGKVMKKDSVVIKK